MSRQINQPINQVRLTNVAIVRMNRGGKRFECACYRNKVVNYRQGLETDLSEVLQTDRIFANVSKGQFAKTSDLEHVFGTRDQEAIAKLILQKGTLQVSDLERNQQYESTLREVATWVANNCVHPTSQRPYTVPQIRLAMKEAEFAIYPTRSVKQQSLDCFKLLQSKQTLPIERAKMKLVLIYPAEEDMSVREALKELQVPPSTTETTMSVGNQGQAVVVVDPSLYRDLDEICKRCNGHLEILQQVVRQEGDVDLELEMERKKQSAIEDENSKAAALLATHMEGSLQSDNDVDTQVPLESSKDDFKGEDNYTEDYRHPNPTSNMRQNQKRANKKSKKAKRREKEEAAERQARIEAERQRQDTRATAMGEQHVDESDSKASQQQQQQQQQGEAKSCNTCGGSFPSAGAYRAHFRSDWHRYNIKLKLKGVAPVGEQEFLLCDSDAFFEDR